MHLVLSVSVTAAIICVLVIVYLHHIRTVQPLLDKQTLTSVRQLMKRLTWILIEEDLIKCRCPHCQRLFTCQGNLVCLFCKKPYGVSPAESTLLDFGQAALDRLKR